MKSTRSQITQVSSGSMADIAFLLLIFFLVTTTILQDKGLTIRLPAKIYEASTLKVQERNLFKVNINSKDEIMVEGEIWNKSLDDLQVEVKKFVMNYNKDIDSSENPEKAIISYKTNRGTSYNKYIQVLDKLKGAY